MVSYAYRCWQPGTYKQLKLAVEMKAVNMETCSLNEVNSGSIITQLKYYQLAAKSRLQHGTDEYAWVPREVAGSGWAGWESDDAHAHCAIATHIQSARQENVPAGGGGVGGGAGRGGNFTGGWK
jgi:hypothetical protein